MNIACATDDNYVQHCGVMLTSLFENNQDEEIHIYLLTAGITGKNKKCLENIIKNYGGHFHYCLLDNRVMERYPQGGKGNPHITLAAYNRFFISYFLPEAETKVIYLDCDIIVCSSLKELWNMDISDYALGAFREYWYWNPSYNERLQYDAKYFYFNSGVLLMNIAYWREKGVVDHLLKYVQNNSEKLLYHDQDALNAVLFANWCELSFKWNIFPEAYRRLWKEHIPREKVPEALEAIRNPGIIHFMSAKPWLSNCEHPCRELYFNYLKKTVWADFSVKPDHIKACRHLLGNWLRRIRGRKPNSFMKLSDINKQILSSKI